MKSYTANLYTTRDCFAFGVILLAVTQSAFTDWIDAADTVGGTAGICTSSVLIGQAPTDHTESSVRSVCRRKNKCYNMLDRHETGRNKIEDCEERLNIEFNNLCYYPSGKRGEVCCMSAQYRECQ